MTDSVKNLLLAKYRPEQLQTEGAPAPSSIQEVRKSTFLPEIADYATLEEWVRAAVQDTVGWPEGLRLAVLKGMLNKHFGISD